MKNVCSHPGSPYPLGATQLSPTRFRFALYSSLATEVVLVLANKTWEKHELYLSPYKNKTGFIWHIEVEGISSQWSYAFRVNGPSLSNTRFNFHEYLADPYAKNIHSPQTFCGPKVFGDFTFSYLQHESFNWEGDRPLNIPKEELIIYEMHTRSFTKDSSSQVHHPGTFLGIIEKIDYFKNLGVNAIELLPIFEFDESSHPFRNEQYAYLCNYWGYSSVNFFSPCRRFASAKDACAPIREFKTLVKSLHAAGIEILLDVVFNHTGFEGTTCSLPWIDLPSYYMMNQDGSALNYSGCGNTVNTNYPTTTQWILDVLRYWVQEMHVDGFRFDLASVFSRDVNGQSSITSPVLQAISFDPVLAKTKIIAEPWDAGGLYELGKFASLASKWSEWNGFYRDNVKAFLNGDPQRIHSFADSFSGSPNIFPKGSPLNSINYICSHDGFTLYDTVAYNQKHNEENGEGNCDGTNENYSYNFGIEGATSDPTILNLRRQQMKNFFITLFLSQGIPMIQSGDEYGHSAHGNNNRWALDNQSNYFLWDQLNKNTDLFDFVRQIILFRTQHRDLFGSTFPNKENMLWLNAQGEPQTWAPHPFLACQYKHEHYHLFIAFNTGNESVIIYPPSSSKEFCAYEIIINSSIGFTQEPLPTPYTLPPYTTLIARSFSLKKNYN